MAVDYEKVADIVKASVAEVMRAEREALCISHPQHAIDHQMLTHCREKQEEWAENHNFISAVRAGGRISSMAGLAAIVVALISFVGGGIWLAIKMSIKP